MQGMNFNYDSTYIQNTIQDIEKPQTIDFSEKPDSSVNFMQMIQSAKTEISEVSKTDNLESVKETDREVTKSSNDTAQTKVNEPEKKSENVAEAAVKDKDVAKAEDVSEKDENKVSDTEAFLARLLNSEKKVETKDSESKTLAAKKALNTFKDVNSNPSGAQKISALKEKVDDAKLTAIIENAKELKLSKKDSEDTDVLTAGLLLSQEANAKSEIPANLMQKNDNANLISKDTKIKKADKKLSDVISVTDLRTAKADEASGSKKSQMTATIKQTANDSATMTLDLNSQAEKNILSLDSQTAGAQGSNFQAMLENQIFENSADFVKAGKIVLKDNDVGNIDLILHPASLGNVKISLELSDKVITGKILVSSQEALEAFNATQESLKAAFIESGFDGASFDVAFANQNPDFSNASQSQQDNSRQAEKAYANYLVENTLVEDGNSDIYNEERDYSLNIVA